MKKIECVTSILKYKLSFDEQTTVIEFQIMNDMVVHQLGMPMVEEDSVNNPIIMGYFRDIIAAMLKGLISGKFITGKFYDAHGTILDEKNGLLPSADLCHAQLHQICKDIDELIFVPFHTSMGWKGEPPEVVLC